ncbi:MAG: cupin domain-containing protein [Verrucomicrobia bacterium]|nr:cupin domain-containing protein [Verrucomicrobiota bacterium]
MSNIWNLPDPLPAEEHLEDLLRTPMLRVERIISTGQVTPPGQWYDQGCDEWVLLLQGQATLEFEAGGFQNLRAGDYLLIPAHRRHRVTFTSQAPPCLWLAIHGSLTKEQAAADGATRHP